MTGHELGIDPDGRLTVKIDVEGHEVNVLLGLETLLSGRSDVRLFVELNPKCLFAAGSSPDALVEWILRHDFRAFLLDDSARSWVEIRSAESWAALIAPDASGNLYCVRRGVALSVSAVMHFAGTAGAERTHIEAVDALVQNGAVVHTVLPAPDEHGLGEALEGVGSSVSVVAAYPWWMDAPDAPVTGSGAAAWARGLVSDAVIAAIAAVDPDVVMTQTGVVPQGAVAAAVLDKPHVWFLHEFGDRDHGYRLPASPAEFGALVAELSTRVVANSTAVRDYFFPTGAEHVTVVHPSPHLEAPTGTPRRAGRPFTLGIVASLNKGKAHEDALAAVAELRAGGLDVPLVLAGAGVPADRDRLEIAAERLGVTDLVTFAGMVANREELYSLFDAVAVTSRSEAFGRVPFEATAAGVPVIYADAGGIGEYMTAGVNGIGYPAGDVTALADGIRSLQRNESLRTSLVAGARASLGDPRRVDLFARSLRAVLTDAVREYGQSPTRLMTRWLSAPTIDGERRCADLARAVEALTTVRDSLSAERAEQSRVLAELGGELSRVRDAFAGLWDERKALQDERERVNLAYAALWRDRAALQEEHDRLSFELAQMSHSHAELLEDRIDADRAYAQLLAERDALELDHRRVVDSRTWRYTRGLRGIRNVLRRRHS
jgi:glycosyltransferase involved in cell wall biosynthesis